MDRMVPTFDLEFIELELFSLLPLGGRLSATVVEDLPTGKSAAQLVSVDRSSRERFQRICVPSCAETT